MIANSASTGVPGVRIAPDMDVSDGLLDVVVIESDTIPMLLGDAADAAQGLQPRGLSRWRGSKIHIKATPRQSVLADGEPAGRTPIDVTVVPGAVGVIVPNTAVVAEPVKPD
jgi:diacylglycerol kinase (ATP)